MEEVHPKDVQEYIAPDGNIPFTKWLDSIRDKKTQAIITKRVDRLRHGIFGDCKKIEGSLYELRIHYGAGHRVYFVDWDRVIIILLCGGDKRTQKRDIQRAKTYWEEFRTRENG